MTNKEAIEVLKLAQTEVEWEYPHDIVIAIDKAIEAMEKQIPKKPRLSSYNYHCPSCDVWLLWDDAIPQIYDNYCGKCGQRIDWEDTSYFRDLTEKEETE